MELVGALLFCLGLLWLLVKEWEQDEDDED